MSPDAPNGAPPESADFAAERVRGSRRQPIVALAWLVVLGGVVAVGLGGRGPSGSSSGGPAASPVAIDSRPTDGVPRASLRPVSPRFDPDFPTPSPRTAVVETSAPGPINLQGTRHPSSVFVHGDIYAQQITWVFVSLQSLDGQVGGWASVSIPGAAGDGRDHRPALRFDVELAIPTAMATGVLTVQANAYDTAGSLVASTRVRLAPEM